MGDGTGKAGDGDGLMPAARHNPRCTVIANFGAMAVGGNLRLHPLLARLVDEDMQAKMRNSSMQKAEV